MNIHDSTTVYADYEGGQVTQVTVCLPPGATRDDVAATVALFLPTRAATVRSDAAETKVMTWTGSDPLNGRYDTGKWTDPERQYS